MSRAAAGTGGKQQARIACAQVLLRGAGGEDNGDAPSAARAADRAGW